MAEMTPQCAMTLGVREGFAERGWEREPSKGVRSLLRSAHDQERLMPRISYFYGIVISMFWDETHHRRPHFHARYGEYRASLDLTGEIIVGELPRRQLRLVQAWTELHADELRADWELSVSEYPLNPIDPLR